MVCYQVVARFAFRRHKAILISTHSKKQNAPAFLVRSGLPFGHGLTYRRFFRAREEAAQYVAYLRRRYKGRIDPYPPLPGGQQYLFQEV